MKDELKAPFLDDWLRDTEVTPPDPVEGTQQVMSQIEETSQVGRWLPFTLFHRKIKVRGPTTNDTTGYQPSPMPATNGQSATVAGRTQSMFSPAKAITAGALVFALGGVLLIAQPFDQQGGTVPGADAPIAPPVEVTGRFNDDSTCVWEPRDGDMATLPGLKGSYSCSGGTTSASDPRLEGTVSFTIEEAHIMGNGLETSELLTAACEADSDCDGPGLQLEYSAHSIENAEGVWRQRPLMSLGFPGSPESAVWDEVYDGEGLYEGLVAVIHKGPPDADDFYGFILDARLLPEPLENASPK